MTSILQRLQRGLETLYRLDAGMDVADFVVNDNGRHAALVGGTGAEARRPREQIIVRTHGDELRLGVFVDARALANLEAHDPARGLRPSTFDDFCLAVEGVSHFIYLSRCAARDRPVSALELELQAEVDKFVSCLLLTDDHAASADVLRARLYADAAFAPDLDDVEHDRYTTANRKAAHYTGALSLNYVRAGRVTDMLAELRWFYRQGIDQKMAHIAHAG